MNSARRFRTVTPRLRHNETARSKTIPGLFTSDHFPESLFHTGSFSSRYPLGANPCFASERGTPVAPLPQGTNLETSGRRFP